MVTRVKIRKLINAVKHFSNEFAEVEAWGDACSTAKTAGNSLSKVSKVGIIDHRSDALRGGSLLSKQVSYSRSGGGKGQKVKPLQPDLNGTRVVKSGLRCKVRVKPLGQRRKTLHPLRAIKERCCSSHDEVEARVSPGIKLIQQLPKSIQPLLPCISAHALQCFSLIKHEY